MAAMQSSTLRQFARGAGAGILVGLAGLVLWLLVSAGFAGYHLAGLRLAADSIRTDLAEGDDQQVAQGLTELGKHAAGLGRWLGGAPWSWFGGLPVVGETVTAGVVLAQASDAVVAPVAPAAAELVELTAGDFAQAAAALNAQAPALTESARAAVAYQPLVASIDPEGVLGPLREPVASAQQEFLNAVPGITGAAAGATVLPGLLGLEQPTDWVLVAAQPAEARGSGAGFWGAFGIMRADDGQLSLLPNTNNELFNVPADLGTLPPNFAALWGEQSAFIWGHNLTRHFPYAAQLMAQSVASLGVEPQYVVALDPRVVAGLLSLTGPVTFGDVTIDEGNAEEFLTTGIYQQFPDAAAKDAVALGLMSQLFAKLTGAPLQPRDLARALAGPLSQQRLVVWAADPAQEEVLALSPIGGAIPTAAEVATVAINNSAGGKMDAFLDTAIDYTLTGCNESVTGSIQVDLTLNVPPDLPPYITRRIDQPGQPYGSSSVLLHFYGPVGASLNSLTIDGATAKVSSGVERDHPVWGTSVELPAGQPVSVVASFAQPDHPGVAQFLPQSMVRDSVVRVSDQRSCS